MQKTFPWQILLDWYEKNGKHNFPWRQYTMDDTHGYRVWLAEILLQQTQADRVVPFYTRILEKYPTVQTLALADYDEFFPYYQWLGYYSRARNLLKTAKIVSEDYAGIFPRDKQKLRKFPWIGEYTARAILAFGYGEPLLAWDTNLETIFSRYYHGSKAIKLSENEKNEIEWDFQSFIDWFQAVNSVGLGERNCLSQIENSTLIAKETSFSLPNSFGTFSTKSTWETVSEKKVEKIETFGTFSYKNIVRNINNALMDWARLSEPKTASLLNPENYIFKDSEFYISNWTSEIIEKKTSTYFPIPDAQVVVILHEDHRLYYTSSSFAYFPFVLPPPENRDTRKYVQDYFRKTYHLELSVRPVHKKWLAEDGSAYIAVNAQVQMGDISQFVFYQKSHAKVILMNIIP
jgi:endonuclease III